MPLFAKFMICHSFLSVNSAFQLVNFT